MILRMGPALGQAYSYQDVEFIVHYALTKSHGILNMEKNSQEVEDRIVESLNDDYIEGLSILGGEPFEPENQERLILLLKKVRNRYKDSKTIWMYSGYLFDKDLKPEDGRKHTKYTNEIFSLIDILVDGPFINEKKRLDLNFRGSSNQRIIDMKETLKQGKVILSPLNN